MKEAGVRIFGDVDGERGQTPRAAASSCRYWLDRFVPSIAGFDVRTRRDLVASLHETMPAIVTAAICAAGVAAIVALRTGNGWFWAWGAAHLAVMVLRLCLRGRLQRVRCRDLWLSWYAIGGGAASALIGLGGLLMVGIEDALVQAVIPICCFAVSAGAAARNAAFPRLASTQIALMLVPCAIQSFLRGSLEDVLFGFLILGGLYGLVTIIRDSFRQTIRFLLAGQRQENLILRLEEQTQAAQAAADAKDRFLHEMSHELRTPLNAIIGFSDAIVLQVLGPIAQPANQERYLAYAGDVRESGQHLLSLVNRVLDVASHDSGGEAASWRDVDCEELLQSVGRMLVPLAEQARVQLELDVGDGMPRFISDELRLRQILLNLAGNAIRFTPSGGTVKVRFDPTPSRDGLLLSVEDTGVGIAEKDLLRVLEPFERAGEALHGGQRGTGLGLALTKRLVDLLGGSLHLSSQLGIGTRAEVWLPALPRRRR